MTYQVIRVQTRGLSTISYQLIMTSFNNKEMLRVNKIKHQSFASVQRAVFTQLQRACCDNRRWETGHSNL